MILVLCVDDEMGMAFNGRRQSRDREVCQNIVEMAGGRTIRMSERSLKLFEGLDGVFCDGLRVSDEDELCFVEFEAPEKLAEHAEKVVLYRWNRRYPADLYCSIPLENWIKTETLEFSGNSHELITREVYVNER